MYRSNGGCWTCRIRHRKCDEKRPACHECTDRFISCHGYGSRPSWVDNQSLLDAELSRIKHAVKENFRRNKRKQARTTQPSAIGTQSEHHAPSRQATETTKQITPTSTQPSRDMTFRESHLLMHYFDYIFPLQFPYYEDRAESGGRGWLFWLLMRSRPLNQAILTLSALHHHTTFAPSARDTENELIEYHTRALQGLRQALGQDGVDGSDEEHQVEFMACGTALISFEVCSAYHWWWETEFDCW